MQYTRETAVRTLLKSYGTYYNVIPFEDEQKPLTAICEFFETSGQYVISRKAELWSADCEEFIFLFEVEHLTLEIFNECRDYSYKEGMKRAHIGPGHMYTYITPVFVCDTCDPDAKKALKKCHIYKSFHFAFHGWMDFHTAVLEVTTDTITTNRSGKCLDAVMKSVLYPQKAVKAKKIPM